MRIVETRKVEDCFNGSSLYRYSFDAVWNQASMLQLSDLGKLSYYPHFPRPFFRVRDSLGMEVKGIEGEDSCLVVLPGQEHAESKLRFETLFETAVDKES